MCEKLRKWSGRNLTWYLQSKEEKGKPYSEVRQLIVNSVGSDKTCWELKQRAEDREV